MDQDKILDKDIIKTARKLLEEKWSRLVIYLLVYTLGYAPIYLIIEKFLSSDLVIRFFFSNTFLANFHIFLGIFIYQWTTIFLAVGSSYLIKNVFENKEFKMGDYFISFKNKTYLKECSIWAGIFSLFIFVLIVNVLLTINEPEVYKIIFIDEILDKRDLSETEINSILGSFGNNIILKYYFWVVMTFVVIIVFFVLLIHMIFWPYIYLNSDIHFPGEKTNVLKNNAVRSVLLSIKLVHKNFGRVLLLALRFIPWFLLLFVTLGIFALWLAPLISLSYYILYLEITKNKVEKLSSNSVEPPQNNTIA